ncbi:hypothetical protein OO185_04800 [Prosthecochloris sp. SCSIO W1102]|uniref:hypothetical protein n=1 Tax=Prosthecochloris sp. SCSIO W1102 TaxID=2992243 RepID=UPI00223C94EF|nr:hypothetical protein [Prosthecochloris sp. SCSIO W1102]UZJ39251.1 hypothetical protein OO185_04800 [Prosthecochloris sp. SCSIO W1102]
MTRKRTIWIILLLLALSGAVGIASFQYQTGSGPAQSDDATTTEMNTAAGQEKLVGTWKLVKASVTPEFLNVPIPINTFEAVGAVTSEHTYTIEANGSFFGSNYGYLGKGDIEIQDKILTLTIGEGTIIVNEKKKKKDKKGSTITGNYRIADRDTLHVEAFKYQDGIRYTFNLALVNF